MSLILDTLTSLSDYDFESSNISFNENKLDGEDMDFNGLDYCVRTNGGKNPWFLTDCNIKCFETFETAFLCATTL